MILITVPQHGTKGTVIRYNKQSYLISFDDCGPEDNATIKSLKNPLKR